MRLLKPLLAATAYLFAASPAFAQAWTTGPREAKWIASPKIGDGSTLQGGRPPAEAHEPAAIGPSGYTPDQWLTEDPSRQDQGEAKFRITCNFSHFGTFDPILFRGRPNAGHHHTFVGNKNTGPNSNYESLRRNPASTCSGGPLNATAYWEPSVMKPVVGGVAAIKPNVISFYYTNAYEEAPKDYRLLRGLAFIGGVDPSDPDDLARKAELKRARSLQYQGNGWKSANAGWLCIVGNENVLPDPGPHRDPTGQYSWALETASGGDPWGGRCTAGTLIASVGAPNCWDGQNLTSPNGRDHFRYSARRADGSDQVVCPDGWWQLPSFIAKVEFSHGGWADYGQWYLSSDRMDPNPAKWHRRGSTFHFDWMNGWQQDILDTWHHYCAGITIDGRPGQPLTCANSTISPSQRMLVTEVSPDERFSNAQVIGFPNYGPDNPDRYVLLGAPDVHSTHR